MLAPPPRSSDDALELVRRYVGRGRRACRRHAISGRRRRGRPVAVTGDLVDPCKNIRKGPHCLRRSTASLGNGMASKMTMGSRTRSSHGAPGRSRMWSCSRRPIPVPPPRRPRAEIRALRVNALLILLSIDPLRSSIKSAGDPHRSVANWRGKSSDKNQNEVGG